jgi:hypothetical protein
MPHYIVTNSQHSVVRAGPFRDAAHARQYLGPLTAGEELYVKVGIQIPFGTKHTFVAEYAGVNDTTMPLTINYVKTPDGAILVTSALYSGIDIYPDARPNVIDFIEQSARTHSLSVIPPRSNG